MQQANTKAASNANPQGQVQNLAKLALTRPEQAVRQILDDEALEQDLSALRLYPEALMSLWRADNAPKAMRASIEVHLEAVGYEVMT